LTDGPWIRHPDEIKAPPTPIDLTASISDDTTIEQNRQRYKNDLKDLRIDLREIEFDSVILTPNSTDMSTAECNDTELLELQVERWFVNSPWYLIPGRACPPSVRNRFHVDWSWMPEVSIIATTTRPSG